MFDLSRPLGLKWTLQSMGWLTRMIVSRSSILTGGLLLIAGADQAFLPACMPFAARLPRARRPQCR
jgi:hypothetical protein